MGFGERLLGWHSRPPASAYHHGDPGAAHGGLIARARLYDTLVTAVFLGRRRRVFDDLVQLAGIRPGDRVLDVGCGTGYLVCRAARIATPGGVVVGIDPSPPMIEYATRHTPPGCHFHIASAQALPYADATYDVVVSSFALHHVPETDRGPALHEMHRVLRPGGRLLLAEFRPPTGRIASHLTSALTGPAMQHHLIDEYVTLLAAAGLRRTGAGDRRPFITYLTAERPGSAGEPGEPAMDR